VLYTKYLGAGTIGNCSFCHPGGSPSALFSYLQGRGYVGGANPSIANASRSCLTWFGGNMPPGGPSSNAQAAADFKAWAAAGGQNN
jgi:hypothetical protein